MTAPIINSIQTGTSQCSRTKQSSNIVNNQYCTVSKVLIMENPLNRYLLGLQRNIFAIITKIYFCEDWYMVICFLSYFRNIENNVSQKRSRKCSNSNLPSPGMGGGTMGGPPPQGRNSLVAGNEHSACRWIVSCWKGG